LSEAEAEAGTQVAAAVAGVEDDEDTFAATV